MSRNYYSYETIRNDDPGSSTLKRKLALMLCALGALIIVGVVGPSAASAAPDGHACEVNVAGCNSGLDVYTGVLEANLASPEAVLDTGFLGAIRCDTSSAEGEVTVGGPPGGPVGYLGALAFSDTRTTTGYCPSNLGVLGNPDVQVDAVDTNGAAPGYWNVEGRASDGTLVLQDVEVLFTLRDSSSGAVVGTCTYEGDEVVGHVNNSLQTLTFDDAPLARTAGPCPLNGLFSAVYDLNGKDGSGNDVPIYLVS